MKIDPLTDHSPSPLGLYIHFPFCLKKCAYCDFYSCPVNDLPKDIYRKYLECLKNDLAQWTSPPAPLSKRPDGSGPLGEGLGVRSIYLGGGTPSLFPVELLEELFTFLRTMFRWEDVKEITIEVNPATVTKGNLTAYKKFGVSRISIGVQSFIDTQLELLGRAHTAAQARDTYELVRSTGFDNVSIDLMFRIPGQTTETLHKDLETIRTLAPEHVSIYSLTLEEGTPLEQAVKKGEVKIPDEDTDFLMYQEIRTELSAQGYVQYEISNFAKPGKECTHNINYWKNNEYIGLGAGAHSQVNGTRWSNPDSIIDYINSSGINRQNNGKITVGEAVFLGLRETGGIRLDSFHARYGIDIATAFSPQIAQLKKAGLLHEVSGYLRLTEKGIFLANQVFMEFV